jgi:hypothetical protein
MRNLLMSYYIVCQKKRNNPRVDVRICQKKCEQKQECTEYVSHVRVLAQSENVASYGEPQSVALASN